MTDSQLAGRRAAGTLVAEPGDLERFPTPRPLMAYVGLVPSEHSSGESQRRGRITEAGNAHVRHVFRSRIRVGQGVLRSITRGAVSRPFVAGDLPRVRLYERLQPNSKKILPSLVLVRRFSWWRSAPIHVPLVLTSVFVQSQVSENLPRIRLTCADRKDSRAGWAHQSQESGVKNLHLRVAP